MIIAAVAAVGLGIDVAVAGTTQAAGLAGVIVGFCELGALVLGVVSRAAQRHEAKEQQASSLPDAPGTAPQEPERNAQPGNASGKYVVDARQAQGVQIGDHGIQRVEFRTSPGGSDER